MTDSTKDLETAQTIWDLLSDRERIDAIESSISDLDEVDIDDYNDDELPQLEILKAEIISDTVDRSIVDQQWLQYESEYYLRAAVSRGDLTEVELLHVLKISDEWVVEDSLFTRDIAYLMTQNIGYTEVVEEELTKLYPQLPDISTAF